MAQILPQDLPEVERIPIKKSKKEELGSSIICSSSSTNMALLEKPDLLHALTKEEIDNSLIHFWNELSATYHLVVKDFGQFSKWNASILDKVLSQKFPSAHQKYQLLDCSCGIGTQAVGLAQIKNSKDEDKYLVTGTTLAPKELERAQEEAKLTHVAEKMTFMLSDMRKLKTNFPKACFDIVITCDALTHLLSDQDIEEALINIRHVLKPGGVLLISIRDYDGIIKERAEEDQKKREMNKPPSSSKITIPRQFDSENLRRVVYQVWDWNAFNDERLFRVNHYITEEQNPPSSNIHTTKNYCYSRLLTRKDLSQFLLNAGFKDITWSEPSSSHFFQPIVTATSW